MGSKLNKMPKTLDSETLVVPSFAWSVSFDNSVVEINEALKHTKYLRITGEPFSGKGRMNVNGHLVFDKKSGYPLEELVWLIQQYSGYTDPYSYHSMGIGRYYDEKYSGTAQPDDKDDDFLYWSAGHLLCNWKENPQVCIQKLPETELIEFSWRGEHNIPISARMPLKDYTFSLLNNATRATEYLQQNFPVLKDSDELAEFIEKIEKLRHETQF